MKDNLRLFFILFIISLLIFALDRWGKLNWLKASFSRLNNPVRRILWQKQAKIADEPEITKIQDLTGQIAVLQAEKNRLTQENASMRKLLGTALPPDWKFTPSHVLGIKEGIMTLDVGERDGIRSGETVLSENLLVGRVQSISPNNCQAELVTAKSLDFKAKTLNSKAEGKMVYDDRLSQLFMTEVLNEYNLIKDEIVVTDGRDGIFPPDLVVGKIAEIRKKEADVYQQAIVEPMVKPEGLTVVFVRL